MTNEKTKFAKLRKARNPFIKAFAIWYLANQDSFVVPLTIIKRTKHFVILSLNGLHPALYFELRGQRGYPQVNVTIEWNGEWWDFLCCFETITNFCDGGYYDEGRYEEYRKYFPTREALWEDHIFVEFRDWLNNTLLSARYLGIYEIDGGGYRWAKLLKDDIHNKCEEAKFILPLWLENNKGRDII